MARTAMNRLLRDAVVEHRGAIVSVSFPIQRRRLKRALHNSIAAYRWAVWQEELVPITKSEFDRFRKRYR